MIKSAELSNIRQASVWATAHLGKMDKYAQITTVLVNAVKEQQAQIEAQQKQIDALKRLVCASNPAAEICAERG